MRPFIALAVALAMVVPAFAIAQVPETGHVPLRPDVPQDSRQVLSLENEEITIVRDAWGVPHIYADSTYALGFGNGYVQAQDRLFQLDVLRHVGKGDLASLLGPAQLPSDLEVRRELYTDAEREAAYGALDAEGLAIFEGFAAGVNRFIAEANANPLRMPAEFAAIAHAVEPWAVTDTLAIAQYLLDYFGSSGGQELANAAQLAHLRGKLGAAGGHDAWSDMHWITHNQATPAIPPSEGRYRTPAMTLDWNALPRAQKAAAFAAADAVPFQPGESLLPQQPEAMKARFGSNAIIVAPERSASGGGLLGGGPQMGYYSPMIPYEVGLHGAGFDVTGIGVGGAPGIVIGRTATFSWTVTSGVGDQVDVVAVKLAPDNPRQYYMDGDVFDMACREEIHIVKNAPPTGEAAALAFPVGNDVLRQEVCRTVHGPVFAINEDSGFAFARERSHRLKEVESGIRWLTIGKGQDLDDFKATLSDFAFTFNFHYVDADNLYFQHTGYQPVRDARLDPRLPRPGDSEFGWKDMLTGDDLPVSLNPERGWIVNWNNVPQRGWTAGDSRETFGAVHRVDVLKERMEAAISKGTRNGNGGKVTLDDVANVVKEAGSRDPLARHTVPFLLDAARPATTPQMAAAARQLAEWKRTDYSWATDDDGLHHPGFRIYEAWRSALQELVFRDELGDHTREMEWVPETAGDPHGGDHAQHGNKDAILVDVLAGRTAHDWCDRLETRFTETCDMMLGRALANATRTLSAEFDSADPADWRLPQVENVYISLSAGPAHRQPLMNRASFNHLHDWGVAGSPASASVLPPGAGSGYYPALYALDYLGRGILPPHARDQLDAYIAWEYKPFNFARADAEAGGSSFVLQTTVPNTFLTPPGVPDA